jgi:hypothetical protein
LISFADGGEFFIGFVEVCPCSFTCFNIIESKCSNICSYDNEFSERAIVEASDGCLFDNKNGSDDLV